MKKLILLATMLVCAAVHAADVPVMNVPTVNQRLRVARDAIQKQDWTRALHELNAVRAVDDKQADVFNLLGYVHRKKSNPDLPKAFKNYKQALALDPNHKGAHEYIGEAYLMDKKPDLALFHLMALEKICGNRECEEYQDLAKAIAVYQSVPKQ